MYGIYIAASNNRIGGTSGTTPGGACSGYCNQITGSSSSGIYVNGTSNTMIAGNFIGTDGTSDIRGNAGDGVTLQGAINACIGGEIIAGGCTPSLAAGDVISGNDQNGVAINAGSGNQVFANRIGTSSSGGAGIPNSITGVRLSFTASAVVGIGTAGSG